MPENDKKVEESPFRRRMSIRRRRSQLILPLQRLREQHQNQSGEIERNASPPSPPPAQPQPNIQQMLRAFDVEPLLANFDMPQALQIEALIEEEEEEALLADETGDDHEVNSVRLNYISNSSPPNMGIVRPHMLPVLNGENEVSPPRGTPTIEVLSSSARERQRFQEAVYESITNRNQSSPSDDDDMSHPLLRRTSDGESASGLRRRSNRARQDSFEAMAAAMFDGGR